ncbi:MAG: tyrosine-type recombinase/integrase [Candidatus Omnitrophota bacterium]
MASIRKRGDRYFIDYRVNGKRVRRSAGVSREQAEQILNELERNLSQGLIPPTAIDVTFEDLCHLYQTQAAQIYSSNTLQRYSAVLSGFQTFLKHETPSIKFINHITYSLIERYKAYRTSQNVKNKTINSELMVLRLVFRLAVKLEYIAINPVEDVLKLEEDQNPSPRYLSQKECELLFQASDRWGYAVFFTLLNTGLRKYEIENLTWSDVDFNQRMIRVHDRNAPEDSRIIPINNDLFTVLIELSNNRSNDQVLIFVDRKGRPLSKNYLRDYLIKTAGKAGINDVTQVNVLRNTFIVRLIQKGVQFNTIKDLMGASYQYVDYFFNLVSEKNAADAVNDLNFKPSDPKREAEE